jgi:hypothetical protein
MLPLKVEPEHVKRLRACQGAVIATASYDMVGVLPKEAANKAASVIFVVDNLLPTGRG